jgi:hypothetical protein
LEYWIGVISAAHSGLEKLDLCGLKFQNNLRPQRRLPKENHELLKPSTTILAAYGSSSKNIDSAKPMLELIEPEILGQHPVLICNRRECIFQASDNDRTGVQLPFQYFDFGKLLSSAGARVEEQQKATRYVGYLPWSAGSRGYGAWVPMSLLLRVFGT